MLNYGQFRDLAETASYEDPSGEDTGFTASMKTGEAPSGGYMVGGYAPSKTVPSPTSTETLMSYTEEHAKPLRGPGMHLGAWNEASRKPRSIDLDVSRVFPLNQGPAARTEGIRRGEKAVGRLEGGSYTTQTTPSHAASKRPDVAVGPRAQKFWIGTGVTKRYPGSSGGVGVERDR